MMAIHEKKLANCMLRQCCLVVLIATTLVSSLKFGLISPIEVVEEWGCQDSIIPLTCSDLDSTIAILEATFKPNCSMSGRTSSEPGGNATENCVQIDLKRLTPPRREPVSAETMAARRFLEVLRLNHNDDVPNEPTVQSVQTASFGFGSMPKDDSKDIKRKRMSLRASLEELLVEYLSGLTPDGSDGADRSRIKRSVDEFLQNNDLHANANENSDAENVNSNSVVRDENGVRDNYNAENTNEIDDQPNAASNSTSFCPERKQRVTQLDRNELNAAIQKESEHEHNIRRLLNYRCSGRNHCSFVFNNDHPFSQLWRYGTVHIKYICMERYRLNKFCGEHLVVVNELPEQEDVFSTQQRSVFNEHDSARESDDENAVERNGPIAEALTAAQQYDQAFHHLKILKPLPSEVQNEQRKSASVAEKFEKPIARKGVYSQDFRVMKVMPSNMDDFNDIEKIADEFYFKKEDNAENDDGVEAAQREDLIQTKSPVGTTEATVDASHVNPLEHADNTKNNEYTFDSSNNGLRDARSTIGYDEMHNHKHHSSIEPIQQTIPTAETATTHTQQSTANLWHNELLPPNTNIFETISIDGNDILTANENQTHARISEKMLTTKNDFAVIKTQRADIERRESDEDESSAEDIAVNVVGPKVWRQNEHRVHTSYQKTAIRQPLQQGFIASPGYPKFYVGNSNCSWRITVPSGQRIRIILLDVNLRYDVICKDYLHIVDVGSKMLLYKNCSELLKPMEIISESNELQIAVRATSALAYPKRGVLIYYTAHGCILPTAPNNGQLISKTDDEIRFLCDPSYVFPDTLLGSRTLSCTERNIWDYSLPNCVEYASVKQKKDDPYVTQLWKQKRLGVAQSANDADAIYDILIPCLLILGLFIVNGFILLIIWRYRKKRKNQSDEDGLARL